MAGNPRIDDLRKRLEKDPGSRLFAQLAEELRKDGEFEEAIAVCRDGLNRQPAYPSARMTLGRALFDTGDIASARAEFETVLKSAPDNILASRLLAECLEGLGDLSGAARQYKSTLGLAPGDKQVQAHLDEVEKKMRAPAAPAAPSAPPPSPAAATILMPPPSAPTILMPPPAAAPPRRFEPAPETSPDGAAGPAEAAAAPKEPQRDFAPIPLVAADEEFELEAAHASPPTKVGGGSANAAGAGWVVGVAMPGLTSTATPGDEPMAAPETTYPIPRPEFPMPEPTLAMPEPAFPMPDEAPTILEPPPVKVAEVDETFEIERPYESPVPFSPPAPPAPVSSRAPEPAPEPEVMDEDFAEEFSPPAPEPPRIPPLRLEPEAPPVDLSAPAPEATIMMRAPVWPAAPTVEPPPPPPPVVPMAPPPVVAAPVLPEPKVEEPPVVAAAPVPPPPAEPDLSSSTLAELYFNQGHSDKALAVYRQLLEREPGNERARARVTEIEALERHLRQEEARGIEAAGAAPADPAAARRQAIERTIGRLEALLAAVKKGEP